MPPGAPITVEAAIAPRPWHHHLRYGSFVFSPDTIGWGCSTIISLRFAPS